METGREARRALALALVVAASAQAPLPGQEAEPGLLVGYSFEEEDLDTGPDTFAVIENSKGSVNLDTAFRLSGYHSVEIRDVAGDGDFPELQGYFDLRREGWLYVHFAFLLTDPDEELNIALAGPRWFRLARDGISFWLSTYNGYLVHYSDSMPKRLLRPRPFTWYHVDLVFDLTAGRYDLRIQEEGMAEPVVDLRDQPNAAAQAGSGVDKFSFIGDRGQDTSEVVYYVDDVLVGVEEKVKGRPFVAPGRRRLFIDSLDHFEKTGDRNRCLPVIGLEDLGVEPAVLQSLGESERLHLQALFRTRLAPGPVEEPGLLESLEPLREALAAWKRGCRALAAGDASEAVDRLADAIELAPGSRTYEAAYVLALAAAGRWAEAEEWMSWLEGEWWRDPRFPVLAARLAKARQDLAPSTDPSPWAAHLGWLREGAQAPFVDGASPLLARLWVGERGRALTAALRAEYPLDWHRHLEQALVPTQYFYLLLWEERFEEAHAYARDLADLLERHRLDPSLWLERAGDASFHAGDLRRARTLYESLLEPEGGPAAILLKLSDVSWALGDLEAERAFREAIYGRLAYD